MGDFLSVRFYDVSNFLCYNLQRKQYEIHRFLSLTTLSSSVCLFAEVSDYYKASVPEEKAERT